MRIIKRLKGLRVFLLKPLCLTRRKTAVVAVVCVDDLNLIQVNELVLRFSDLCLYLGPQCDGDCDRCQKIDLCICCFSEIRSSIKKTRERHT